MKTIWKYDIEPKDGPLTVDMPIGAQFLSVQTQHNKPRLWVLVDGRAQMETRTFYVFGTGHTFNPQKTGPLRFIGTCQQYDGDLVWHVFVALKIETERCEVGS